MASWTEDELALLRQQPFVTNLPELLPRHTLLGITSKRRQLGIYMSHEQRSEVRRQSQCSNAKRRIDQQLTLETLPNRTYQVLIGSLLGDGCVTSQGGEYMFQEGHSLKQQDYLLWKQIQLAVFHAKDAELQRADAWQGRCLLRTGVHPIFTQIRHAWYTIRLGDEKKSRIPDYVDSQLDLLGLLIWYLDDGTRGNPHLQLSIAGGTWPYTDLERLVTTLNTRLHLHLHIVRSKDPRDLNHSVSIDARDRNYLLAEWRKIAKKMKLPDAIMYKLPAPPLRLRRCYGMVCRSDGKEFRTQIEAARASGISACTIQGVLAGRRKTAGGFSWEYRIND